MATDVLIVDDDRANREALRLILEDEGYHVHEAPDGHVAFGIIRESPHPMVVLTSHNMPVLDGPGLLSFVASDPKLANRGAFIYMTPI
jgi:CheY-like chemotaxis protein